MKTTEIRALSDTELLNELENAVQKLFNLRLQRTTQNLESTAELGNTRRDIGRMRTILAERQRSPAGKSSPVTSAPAEEKETAEQ